MNQRSEILISGLISTLLTTLLALTACQPNQKTDLFDSGSTVETSDSHIVGGRQAYDSDDITKSVAGVWIITVNPNSPNQFKGQFATAVVLSDHILATAAHTFQRQKFGPETLPDGTVVDHKILIRFGANLSTSRIDYYITPEELSDQRVFRIDYTGPDIVFIYLKNKIPPGYRNMLLSTDPEKSQPGTILKIAGYGNTSNGGNGSILYTGELKVTANDPAKAEFNIPDMLRALGPWFQNNFLETDETGATSFCLGDSGAPLYFEKYVNGVLRSHLIGVHLYQSKFEREYCKAAGYAVRVNGFLKEALDFRRRTGGPQ